MSEVIESTVGPKPPDYWKWLVGILGGVLIASQVFSWVEGRIERRVEERVRTANALSYLENSGRESKTWMDGRCNTLSAELDALRRELSLLRQDVRINAQSIATTPSTPPAPAK